MGSVCIYNTSVCIRGRRTFSCIISSVVLPASSLIRDRWVFLHWVGCTVVVLVLASVFLHVKISVKVVRVFLGNVTSFWSTFVLGGGGVM